MNKFRLFGVFNPIDILILTGVAALVVAAYFFAVPQRAAAGANSPVARYTIELAGRAEGFHKEIAAGAAIYDTGRGSAIGKIVDAYAMPYKEDAPDEANNIFRRAEVEGLEFTYIVVESPVSVTDSAISIGDYTIAVNKEVFVRSKAFAGQGYITEIEY